MADRRRCLVELTVVTATGAVRLGPGQVVDLDQAIGRGQKLRDAVKPAWFAPIVPDPRPPARRRPGSSH